MIIAVGSTNKCKIAAAALAVDHYERLRGATVSGCEVVSGVCAQPTSLDEIITGAKNRARSAFECQAADLGVGLESGIFPVPHTKSGYMDVTACAIFDGEVCHVGLSSCFEYPKKIVDMILAGSAEVADAAVCLGFAEDRSFREEQGMIGLLTGGKISRTVYNYQAMQTALVHLDNPEHY